MQEIKLVKAMKTQLLIVSSLFLLGCSHKVSNKKLLDGYEFDSLKKFGKEIKDANIDKLINNINNSKQIKGPVIGADIQTMFLVNKNIKGDTLKVIIYGKDARYFRIGERYYQVNSNTK